MPDIHDWIKKYAPKPPPKCPDCGGDTECGSKPETLNCFFCGLTDYRYQNEPTDYNKCSGLRSI